MSEHRHDPTPPAQDPPSQAGAGSVVDPRETAAAGVEPPRRRRRLKVIVASAITGTLVTGAASYAVVSSRGSAEEVAGNAPAAPAPSGGDRVVPSPPGLGRDDPFGALTETTDTTAATAEQQVGVVDIYTVLSDGSEAAGTGMLLSSDGEVLTNNHVIKGSTDIRVVVVSTDKTYDATVVGTDAGDDIALLQLAGASGLDTVTTDTSGDVQVGDPVTGVGNAGGDGGDPSAAAGQVVALDRDITVHSVDGTGTERLKGLIEVDADIMSGDSGGPLYDGDNEVIGIDTAASSGRADVSGFAIPISTALEIVEDIEAGRTTGGIELGYPAFLGIGLSPFDGNNGALVAGVQPGSAAARAGLVAGDTITSFDGRAVRSTEELRRLVDRHEPGDRATVVWRDSVGGAHSATVTLGEGPAV